MSARTLSMVFVLVGVCLLTVGLQAATYTWDGPWAANWSDPTQWIGGPATPGPGDTAQFLCAYYPNNDCVTLDSSLTVANVFVSTTNDPYQFNILGSTTLTVTGSFTFNAVTGNGLLYTDNAPPYSFPLANGGKGFISCLLSGGGSVIVNSGTLDLENTGNNFSGGIYVNGGYLTTDVRSAGCFGGNTIYLGDSAAGDTDATLEPAGGSGVTYSNPIVVQGGNSGQAIITYSPYDGNASDFTSDWYTSSLTYSGPITLYKDVTFLNNARAQNATDPLVIGGTVSGNFGVTVDGSSWTYLSGNNTYHGATTITGAAIAVLNGASPTFLGPINVEEGALYATSDAALGDPSNVLTLGTAHSIGGFGPYDGTITFTHAISIDGNGYLSGAQADGGNSAFGEFQGVISDGASPGRLIIGMQGVAGWKSTYCFMKLDANNTYTGGTVVVAGAAGETSDAGSYDAYYNNTIFGAGDLSVLFDGLARITDPANVGGKIFVNDEGFGGGLAVGGNFMPDIDPSSSGTLMWSSGPGGNFAAALANASSPIGNGYMYLGSFEAYQYIPDAASFAALVANQTPAADGSKTYFIGNGWAGAYIGSGLNDFATGSGNQVMNVQIGKPGLYGENTMSWVTLAGGGNDFSGALSIACGSALYCAGTLGSAGGAVYLNGCTNLSGGNPGHTLILVAGPSLTTKGDVYFNGATDITFGLWNGNNVAFAAASYNRQNRGTLSFRSEQNDLGAGDLATVTGTAPTVNNNMVAAYFWQSQDYYGGGSYSFLTYGANGFTPVSVYLTSLAASTPSSIVYTPGEAVIGSEAAYAILATGALTGTGTVTVGDGVNPAGVIFAAAATHTANFAFGGSEGILYTPYNSNTVISGTVSGTNGITKSGGGSLELQGNNAGLSGSVTVNEGNFILDSDANVGSANIALNGGSLTAGTTGKTIVIGPNGGTVSGTFNGNIVDMNPLTPGPLIITGYNVNINGTGNTYSGGTFINSAPLNNLATTVGPNSCLGTGDVIVDCYPGALPSWGNILYLEGDHNLSTSARLVLMSANSEVQFDSQNPSVGSIEGVGTVQLGGSCDGAGDPGPGTNGNPFWNTGAVLTTGLNNLNTEFYGTIEDTNSTHGGTPYFVPRENGGDYHRLGNLYSALIKDGTGTFTLWGPVTFYGQTTVHNGTLVNNDLISGNVLVTPGGVDASPSPVYDGTGTTNGSVEIDTGGRLQGGGCFKSGVFIYGGTANVTGAVIEGGLEMDTGSYSGSSTISGNTPGSLSGNPGSESLGGIISGTHTINGGLTLDSMDAPAGLTNNGLTETNTVNGSLYVGYFGDAATVSGATVVNAPGGTVALYAGGISGANTITAGSVVIGGYGACSFSGAGTVNAGSFTENDSSSAVSGTYTFNAPVLVNGGTFQGNHTIHGSFTTAANSYAIVAPHNGATAGTMTIVGNVTLDASTTLDFNLGTPGTIGGGINDLIDITGSLSLDGTLNVTGLTGFSAGTYTLFTYTGSLTEPSGPLTLGAMPSGMGYTYTIDTSTFGQVNLDVVMPWQPGDTNHDGLLNSLDIDAIYHNFGAPATSQWKVDGDGNVVGQGDVTYELHTYFHTNYGDANLDTKTDFSDFQVLLDHWQVSGPTIGWTQGDFNGSYTVDFLDFQVLLDYWNPGGWSFAPAQTPEPASLTLLLLGGLALLRRSRKA